MRLAAAAAALAFCATFAPAAAQIAAPLQLAKTRLQLHANEATAIGISGGTAPYSASVSAPVADAAIDAVAHAVTLRAHTNGSATLTITDANGGTVTATLLVAPSAGFVPPELNVALLGSPSHDFVVSQVRAALVRAAHPYPGVRLTTSDLDAAGMRPGERLDATVRVHLDGAGRYVDVDALTLVHVVTTAARPAVPERVVYSDDPERVRGVGVLLRATLSAGHPIRLYYYHQAQVPGRAIAVLLDAPAGTAQVQIFGEGAGPNPAVMFVGQTATYRYLDDRARGAGVLLDVPTGTPTSVLTADDPLQAGDLVAGVLDFAIASGDPVRVTVLAFSAGSVPARAPDTDELAGDGKRRRGEYDLAGVAPMAFDYAVGGAEPATFVVGGAATALPNLRPGGHALLGDYGVLRPVALTLSNPTPAAATVTLYERPVGFPVTTTIYFDGESAPLRVQCVKDAAKRYRVRSFSVPAETTERVSGTYMTDGASTYPLTFGLTAGAADDPPAAMRSPDGCFPLPAQPASP